MSREVMQMALEALNRAKPACFADTTITAIDDAITALRQALVDADDTSQKRVDEKAKREHEPVAWISEGGDVSRSKRYMDEMGFKCNPLYTAPPKRDLTCVCGAVWEGEMMVHPPRKREWVGLTDDEIMEPWPFENRIAFARWLESKIKENNCGH